MAKGVNIPIASETREFSQGVKTGVIKPLEDAAESLDDVAKAGDDAGDQLEKGFEKARKEVSQFKKDQVDLGKTIAKENREAGRDFNTLGDAIEKSSKRGYKAMSTESKVATTQAQDDLRELGNESKANLAETLSSFDGTVEGFVSGIQGTLGGVTAGLTGVGGIIAAAAGAAGLGLVIASLAQGTEESERFRAKVGELADEFIDTGGLGKVSIDYLVDKLKELATASEEGETSLKQLKKIADGSGSSFKDLALAYAGNSEELDKLIRLGDKRLQSLEDEAQAIDTTSAANNGQYSSVIKKSTAQEQYNKYLDDAKRLATEAAATEANYALAGGPAMEMKAALIAAVDAAYDDAAGAVDNYINKESGTFDTAAYIAAMGAKSEALREYQATLAESALTPEAKAFLNEQGIDSAASFLAGYKSATPAQQAELNRIWTEAARQNSGSYTTAVKDALGTSFNGVSIPGPVIVPRVDTTSAEARLDALARRKVDIEVGVRYRNGKPVI